MTKRDERLSEPVKMDADRARCFPKPADIFRALLTRLRADLAEGDPVVASESGVIGSHPGRLDPQGEAGESRVGYLERLGSGLGPRSRVLAAPFISNRAR